MIISALSTIAFVMTINYIKTKISTTTVNNLLNIYKQ